MRASVALSPASVTAISPGTSFKQREHHEGREQDHGQRLQQAAADHPCRTSSRHPLQLSSQTSSYFGLPSRFGL